MSFFEPPPPAPEPREEKRRQPAWAGPPDNVLGAPVPLRVVLAKTEDAAVAISGARAYPRGAVFELVIRLRRWHDQPDFFHPFLRPARGGLPDDLFRFGVQLADGSKATTLQSPLPFPDEQPDPPVLIPRGGGGGGRSWDWRLWLWPLPLPGPLAFVVEWPAERIPETRVEIDAAPILEAAQRAEVLWEDGDVESGGGFTAGR